MVRRANVRTTARDILRPASVPTRPTAWPALVAYVVAIGLAIAMTATVVFGVAFLRFPRHPAQVATEATRFAASRPGIMAAAFVSSATLAMVAVIGARLETRDVAGRLRLGATQASGAGLVAAVVAMAGLTLTSGAAIDLLGLQGSGNMAVIAHALARPTPGQLLVAIVTIAIAPGVAEETFFRGFIQTALTSRWRRWPSILVTALAFGLMHFDLVQGVAAFIAGLLLGWLVERFRGVRPSMAAHACNNAVFVALASFSRADTATRTVEAALIVIGLVAFVGATAVLQSGLAIREQAQSSGK